MACAISAHALGFLFVLGASAAAMDACDDNPQIASCGEIPAGGCPRRGDTCGDRTCASVYACGNDGQWSFVQTCPAQEGGASPDASADGASDAQPLRDASIFDVPGAAGGPGCPDLQPSDCPLARLEYCPENQCCDCEALFYCGSGGWQPWGDCLDGGTLEPAP
ncbi:MAG TPA: hypothetical protein VNO21_10145 [Polyangiaceae bacterium]|nr:hypothetical protein [Polyangiaceae bacterium]